MYLWKAWHDCRAHLILYLCATVSVGVLCGLEVLASANFHAYMMTHPYPYAFRFYNYDYFMDVTFRTIRWAVIGYYGHWDLGFLAFRWEPGGYGPVVMLVAGLSLGAGSVGREYGAGTMNYVLTRPSPKVSFILTDWTVGLTCMVIILSGLTFSLLPFLYAIHAKGPGNILASLPALWVMGAATYGLSHFTTLVSGSAPKGLTLSAAVLLTYAFLPTALYEWWHTDAMMRAVGWTLRPLEYDAWPLSPFAWSAAAFWLALAAGFLIASLAWIRRREV